MKYLHSSSICQVLTLAPMNLLYKYRTGKEKNARRAKQNTPPATTPNKAEAFVLFSFSTLPLLVILQQKHLRTCACPGCQLKVTQTWARTGSVTYIVSTLRLSYDYTTGICSFHRNVEESGRTLTNGKSGEGPWLRIDELMKNLYFSLWDRCLFLRRSAGSKSQKFNTGKKYFQHRIGFKDLKLSNASGEEANRETNSNLGNLN